MDATLHSDHRICRCIPLYTHIRTVCGNVYLQVGRANYSSLFLLSAHTHSTHHLHLTQRVELRFHPHPNDSSVSSLGMRVLSTTPATTVGHLVKYLVVRNALQRKEREGTGWHLTHSVCHTLCSMPAIEHGMPSPLCVVKLPTPTLMHIILVTCANLQNVWVYPFDVHAECSIGESRYLENCPLSHSISLLSCGFDLKLKELANLALLNDTFCMQHTPWTIVLSIHCG